MIRSITRVEKIVVPEDYDTEIDRVINTPYQYSPGAYESNDIVVFIVHVTAHILGRVNMKPGDTLAKYYKDHEEEVRSAIFVAYNIACLVSERAMKVTETGGLVWKDDAAYYFERARALPDALGQFDPMYSTLANNWLRYIPEKYRENERVYYGPAWDFLKKEGPKKIDIEIGADIYSRTIYEN